MAPHADRPSGSDPAVPFAQDTRPIGPPSGILAIPSQWHSEQGLQHSLKQLGFDEKREDGYRLKGVQLIDAVRQSLHLWVLHLLLSLLQLPPARPCAHTTSSSQACQDV
jgi:CTD kinase subunit beta